MLKLWNTASRRLEEFAPLRPPKVGLYACGPTVYQRVHIGNLRTYLMEDLLRRTLQADGYEVRHVVNITDVGHLTDDADTGQDKMEKASHISGMSAWEIAEKYTDLFLKTDLPTLNILSPTVTPHATATIADQIALIQTLETGGYAYRISDGIYFDTLKFKEYGAFSGQPLEEKEDGARVAVNVEKHRSTDFALWKFSPKNEKRQMEWESPWGVGFPGWHIECSAMSRRELGQPFDIHAGGVDHIPVHHENEIAQSVAAYGLPLSCYWFHVEFLLVDGQKMGKSLGNSYLLDDIIKKGFDPLAFRFFLLGAHYRQKQNFTWEALSAAQSALEKIRRIVREWDAPQGGCMDFETEFMAAVHDDLNMPRALAVVWKMIDSENATAEKSATILKMNAILGLGLDAYVARPVTVPADIEELIRQRADARTRKDWAEADRLRDVITALGWSIEDTTQGQKLQPSSFPKESKHAE